MTRLYIVSGCLVGFLGGFYVASQSPVLPERSSSTINAKCESTSSEYSLSTSATQNNSVVQTGQSLNEADKEIERLRNMNAALTKQIDRLNLPLPATTSVEDLVYRLDKLPDSFIEDKLKLVLRENSLDLIEDTRLFSKRLLEAALDPSPTNIDDASATVEFFTSPQYGINPVNHGSAVTSNDRIFAHITPIGPLDKVFVKWQNMTTGEILMLRDHTLNTKNGTDYFSLRPSGGWKSGTYQVSIYQVNDTLSPIGSNQYSISINTDAELDEKTSDQAINESLIVSGQAVPKNVQ